LLLADYDRHLEQVYPLERQLHPGYRPFNGNANGIANDRKAALEPVRGESLTAQIQ